MSSLDYLRGERKIKERGNTDRRMLSTKISELNEQVKLDVVDRVTFECISKRTREFSKLINTPITAQRLLDDC